MHSAHIEDAINAAVNGDAVGIFAETWERTALIAKSAEGQVPEEWVQKVSRLNGDRYIDFKTGGRLRFISLGSSGGRGLSLDRVFVPIGTSPDRLSDIIPTIAASPRGYLTGY